MKIKNKTTTFILCLCILVSTTSLNTSEVNSIPLSVLLKSLNSKWIVGYLKSHDISYILRNDIVGTNTSLKTGFNIRIEKETYLKDNSINDYLIYESFKTKGNKGVLYYYFSLDLTKKYKMTFQKDDRSTSFWDLIEEEEIDVSKKK